MSYHISKKGLPEKCTATKRACPLGGPGEHFNTMAEAYAVANERFEARFGIEGEEKELANSAKIGETTYIQATYFDPADSSTHDKDLPKIVEALSPNKKLRAGMQYETYGAMSYAEEIGATDNVLVTPENGSPLLLSNSTDSFAIDRGYDLRAQVTQQLTDKFRAEGKDIKDPEKLVKAIHYNDAGDKVVVQMGGSNVLDLAVIDGNDVSVVEFKKCSGQGSQLPSISLRADKDGKPVGEMPGVNEKIQTQVKKIGFKDTFGYNHPVNITNKEALEYVVDSYKDKGADKLSYINKKNEVIQVDLHGDTGSIVNRLEENNIRATLRLRSNMTSNNPTDQDKERWASKRGHYFKSGEFPKETFTKRDLANIDYNSPPCSGKATHGELVLPMTKAEFKKLPPDAEIKLSKLKVRGLDLIGDMKEVS